MVIIQTVFVMLHIKKVMFPYFYQSQAYYEYYVCIYLLKGNISSVFGIMEV